MKLLIITLQLLLTQHIYSSEICFPKNNLRYGLKQKNNTGVKLYELTEIVSNFEKIFGTYIKNTFKKKIIINTEWENDRVNAFATRDDNNNPVINILGGMVRHPDMTKDGMYLILCHELGHQLGGAPKKFRGTSQKRSWSSAEGQADYFSVTKCLPKIFKNHEENKRLLALVDEDNYQKAKLKCSNDQCIRIVLAGLSVGKVFASLKTSWEEPKIESEYDLNVASTNYNHPAPQCRLLTYISGARCEADNDINFDDTDPKIGSCYRTDNGYSDDSGSRPLCWYKPEALFK
jgi:hypothetical protein